MRATGIIKRIDDLGRIAIPKNIRDRIGLKENDPIEFYLTMDCDGIILKKRDGSLTFADLQRILCHYFDYCDPKEEEQEKEKVKEFIETM